MRRSDPLARWFSLEQEAVWFYATAGAQVDEATDRARSARSKHQAMRDRLLERIGDPSSVVQPSYDVGPLESGTDVAKAARDLERRIAAACVAVMATRDRALGLSGLRRAARAEMTWTTQPTAFPGLD